MKSATLIASMLTVVCVLGMGCETATPRTRGKTQKVNEALVSHYSDAAVENAIVSQATLYPYCYVQASPELNKLGSYHLQVLTEYYLEHPGVLHIRRGNAEEQLYNQRVDTVTSKLKEAGVDLSAMDIDDRLPGGRGAPSEEGVKAREKSSQSSQRSSEPRSNMTLSQ
ncbi:MAG: hypothetical protein ACOC0A_00250 [Planctomycetota bacterium]